MHFRIEGSILRFQSVRMKTTLTKKFIAYICNNFIGNFLGFAIGVASTGLISHFFTTRSIRNLWGLTARKTVVDKQTFSAMEWMISIIFGFIVFEIVSKWLKKKIDELMIKYKNVSAIEKSAAGNFSEN